MQVNNLKAEPDPRGGRINLSWTNPDFPKFKGVKILRRAFTFPGTADIGTDREIYDEPASPATAGKIRRFSDTGLKGETVYYYAVVVYDDSLPNPNYDAAFVSAITTTPYKTAEDLYKDLPGLYRNYDLFLPPEVPELDPVDKDKGQLQRLVEMFGLQFDLLRSFASGVRDFSNIDQIDGALLPLLAQWIGWQTNFTLNLARQRNEIKYAPHFYRTTGIAANLRATINRLTKWDAQIKEFVHNIFLSNNPEQLTLWEKERRGGVWQPAKPVTLDVAYEGKPAIAQSQDGRPWLFYHARQSKPLASASGTPVATQDQWRLWYKIYDQGEWLASRHLALDGDINKYPAALQKSSGAIWLFWGAYQDVASKRISKIKLNLLSTGRPARPARIQGTNPEPFALSDGDTFVMKVTDGVTTLSRVVIFRNEHFRNMGQATAEEVATLLNRELPGVEVTVAENKTLILTTLTFGAASQMSFDTSNVAAAIGLAGSANGSDSMAAQFLSDRSEPFSLVEGDQLTIRVDRNTSKIITFRSADFGNITQVTATEVAKVINRFEPGAAQAVTGRIRLTSPTVGEASFIAVDLANADSSTAAPKLGFGAPVPPISSTGDETEPAAFEDSDGHVWLFWSSPIKGGWKIWYNRFDTTTTNYRWGSAKLLTSELDPDREPAVVFDSTAKTIWVFWSRKKINGFWNIFYRTTTHLDFDGLTDADWKESELEPIPINYDNKEPEAISLDTDLVELYFSSNRTDGWNVWSKEIKSAPAGQGSDTQITLGQYTQRAPVALKGNNQDVQLWFRSNESQIYTSSLYPAAKTRDARYSGSTTADTRNPAKINLRGNIDDVHHYTYDVLKGKTNWYARDTVGIYLTADTNDPEVINRNRALIENGLKSFLPIQVRAVLIIQTPAGFLWLRMFGGGQPPGMLPDLSVTPPNLSFRLFLKGVTEGV
jgi:hypothetical protein